MDIAVMLVVCAVLALLCCSRLGVMHPVSLTMLLWLVLSLLLALHPLGIAVPGWRAVLIVLTGLVALCVGPLLLAGVGDGAAAMPGGAVADPRSGSAVRVGWLITAVLVLLAGVAWGVLSFRTAVSDSIGRPFGELDAQQVRWAQLYGAGDFGGFSGATLGLSPLLGALAILGGLRHRRAWFLLLPIALLLTMQSPSRSATLTLAVTNVVFFLTLTTRRGTGPPGHRVRPHRAHASLVSAAAGALALGYFLYVGSLRDGPDLPYNVPAARWLPRFLVEPVLYEVGGFSAFSSALDRSTTDGWPYGAFGRSVYGLLRQPTATPRAPG